MESQNGQGLKIGQNLESEPRSLRRNNETHISIAGAHGCQLGNLPYVNDF